MVRIGQRTMCHNNHDLALIIIFWAWFLFCYLLFPPNLFLTSLSLSPLIFYPKCQSCDPSLCLPRSHWCRNLSSGFSRGQTQTETFRPSAKSCISFSYSAFIWFFSSSFPLPNTKYPKFISLSLSCSLSFHLERKNAVKFLSFASLKNCHKIYSWLRLATTDLLDLVTAKKCFRIIHQLIYNTQQSPCMSLFRSYLFGK